MAFNARLPKRLHDALKADAAAHRRSLNGMLIELLIARYEPPPPQAEERARLAPERAAKRKPR